jgi:hypothetical protein
MTESNDRIAELERVILRRRSGLGAYLEVIDDTRALIAADEAELSRLRAANEQQEYRELSPTLKGFRYFAHGPTENSGTHIADSLVAHIEAEATKAIEERCGNSAEALSDYFPAAYSKGYEMGNLNGRAVGAAEATRNIALDLDAAERELVKVRGQLEEAAELLDADPTVLGWARRRADLLIAIRDSAGEGSK